MFLFHFGYADILWGLDIDEIQKTHCGLDIAFLNLTRLKVEINF